jgi:hypothetical protein
LAAALTSLALVACSSSSPKAASGSSASSSAPSASSSSASSSGDAGSSASSGGDLCRLVTKAEAESYTGKTFGDPRATSSEGPLGTIGSCVYLLPAASGGVSAIVNVIVVGTKVTADVFDSQISSDAPDAPAVSGVGEKALLIQPGILAVLDHGVALSVEIIVDGTPAAQDVLVQAAKKALDRL